ncbi:20840_t:CDS:2, partial [Gigaspora margarita]
NLTKHPKTALESSLLRQLKYYKTKSVFIPNNKNRNPRSLVFIYFAESQDLNKAISQSIYYYNTRLHWKLEGSLLCTHKEKSIAREEYNPNKENLPEIEPSIKTEHSNTRERIYRKQQEREHKDSLRYEQYRFTTRKKTTRGNTGKTKQFRRKA